MIQPSSAHEGYRGSKRKRFRARNEPGRTHGHATRTTRLVVVGSMHACVTCRSMRRHVRDKAEIKPSRFRTGRERKGRACGQATRKAREGGREPGRGVRAGGRATRRASRGKGGGREGWMPYGPPPPYWPVDGAYGMGARRRSGWVDRGSLGSRHMLLLLVRGSSWSWGWRGSGCTPTC